MFGPVVWGGNVKKGVLFALMAMASAAFADGESSVGGPAPKPKTTVEKTENPAQARGAFYVVVDGKAVGPIKDQAVRDLIDADKITRQSLVWWDGQPDWVELKDAKQLEPVLKAVYLREAHNAKTFLSGVWNSGDYFDIIEGIGQGRMNATYTFDYERNFTAMLRSVVKNNTTYANSTQVSNGLYTAWLSPDGTLQIHFKGEQTEHSPTLKKGSKTTKMDQTAWFDKIDADTFRPNGAQVMLRRQD